MDRHRRATLFMATAAASALVGWGVTRETSQPPAHPARSSVAAIDPAERPPRLLDLPHDVRPISLRQAPRCEPTIVPQFEDDGHASQSAQWEASEARVTRLPSATPTPVENGVWRMPDSFDHFSLPGAAATAATRSLEAASAPAAAWPHEAPPVLSDPPIPTVPSARATLRTPEQEQQLAAVELRATSQVQRGLSLAERGAHYTARREFLRTLQLLAQSLDVAEGTRAHSERLAAGLRALEESADFQFSSQGLAAAVDLENVVAGHRTPVLKDKDLTRTSPLEALQVYYTFAQHQLAASVGNRRAGSLALFAMGKLHGALAASDEGGAGDGPKALVFHQAALVVDPQNHLAANELGVLLAKYEQWERARAVLSHSVSVHPTSFAWHNLAVVHERLGESELALRARQQTQDLARLARPVAGPAEAPMVRWLAPNEFAKTAPGGAAPGVIPLAASSRPSAAGAPIARPDDTAWWKPWTWVR